MTRRLGLTTLLGGAVGSGLSAFQSMASPARSQSADAHIAWVEHVLSRLKTVKVDMTRAELLKVFATQGGLSTGLKRTFASRDCPYFHVDVKFQSVRRPDRDLAGRVTSEEDPRDVIVEISKPYLRARCRRLMVKTR